jgi:2-polyprenyl-6-methoxyphenol hydroxylase-like FAD-dependent oxidoreductase
MMLGYLLARAGIEVIVLEKHRDFNRDFRGDTVHPSTLEVLYELGLLDNFLKVPHQKVTSAGVIFGGVPFAVADFSGLPVHCKFVALMPQWDFLNFLAEKAKRYSGFELRMQHEVVDVIQERGRITGVVARVPDHSVVQVKADLVVACDGRHSATRAAAGLEPLEFGVPIDVLWFRISRRPDDPSEVLGNVNYGRALILINRTNYFQAGLIIPKGSFDDVKRRGLAEFRATILKIAPYLGERVDEIRDWEQVKILTVRINRLPRWYRDGLLCIGDAAHAMSPAGGVGINLAIQDAVAAANLLTGPLQRRKITEALLASVQRRRDLPTRLTQTFQLGAHNGFAQLFRNAGPARVPWQVKAVLAIPGIHKALGYAVGIGARPEHVEKVRKARRRNGFVAIVTGVALGIAVTIAVLTRARASDSACSL